MVDIKYKIEKVAFLKPLYMLGDGGVAGAARSINGHKQTQ